MPGPVSSSFDPEFSTAENAYHVFTAVEEVRDKISSVIGDEKLHYILDIIKREPTIIKQIRLNDIELRVLRFALNRALGTL